MEDFDKIKETLISPSLDIWHRKVKESI
jgi:hypothetical protein